MQSDTHLEWGKPGLAKCGKVSVMTSADPERVDCTRCVGSDQHRLPHGAVHRQLGLNRPEGILQGRRMPRLVRGLVPADEPREGQKQGRIS